MASYHSSSVTRRDVLRGFSAVAGAGLFGLGAEHAQALILERVS